MYVGVAAQHHVNTFIFIPMYLKVYVQNLVKNGQKVSEKIRF